MKRFIISSNGNRFVEAMFYDLLKDDSIIRWDNICNLVNKLEYIFYRLHTSKKINNYLKLPFREMWVQRKNYAKTFKLSDTDTYHILFFNTSFEYFPINDLKMLQHKPNVKISLVMIDPCGKNETRLAEQYINELQFEHIFTFDDRDAKIFGFEFSNQMYSMFPADCSEMYRVSDLYFIGYNKGRAKKLCDLYRRLESEGVQCDFTVNGSSEEIAEVDCLGVHTNRFASYRDVVNEIQGTNCIFEMLQEGQHGTTLRYYEAVCFNKKLLTNNPDITSYHYYDSRFMRYYSNIEEIDPAWILKREDVNYNYSGYFSPHHLLDRICRRGGESVHDDR